MNEVRTGSREQLAHLTLEQIRRLRSQSRPLKTVPRVPPLVPQLRPQALPLSYAQERLWFLGQLGLVGPAYNVPMGLRLKGELNVAALDRSFATLVARHETLRTRFASVEGSPIQVVEPSVVVPLTVRDLSQVPHDADTIAQLTREEAAQPFDLNVAPLLRVSLLKLAADEHILLLTLHHIIADGWSIGVLNRELSSLYGAYAQGMGASLHDLPVQYADYAIWQRQWLAGGLLERQIAYWREQLQGAPAELQLPRDRQRPPLPTFRGGRVAVHLSSWLHQSVDHLAKREGATLFMVALAAYQVLLARYSAQDDIVIGSVIAGRLDARTEDLIGFFVNTLPLRADLSTNPTFVELLEQVKRTTLGAYAHQDVPFEKLVTELRPERSLARQPIFQVALVLQNFPQQPLSLPGIHWSWLEAEHGSALFDLTLHLTETPQGLEAVFDYAVDVFDRSTIERLAESFAVLLEEIIRNPQAHIQALPLLTARERERVLFKLNATSAAYARDRTVHQLFEEQVARTPQAPALIHEGKAFTYDQINRNANQLARYLKSHGVVPDTPVAVCVERRPEMVVAVLAVLKAGAAYLPLDPNYPAERLSYMLEDAAPAIVLTQESLRPVVPDGAYLRVSLDATLAEWTKGLQDDALTWGPQSCSNEHVAQHLVYLIYTSGSTGRPKGTAMPHQAMVNLIEWQRHALPLHAGERVLQFAALSFDVAFQEIFTTLCTGGTLVLVDEWTRRDPRPLKEFLRRERIGRLFVPPVMLQQLAECSSEEETLDLSLRDVIVAGEQLRLSSEIRQWFAGLPGCRLHNHYGPTETHVITALTLADDPRQWPALPPIGRPIANSAVYVLDAHQQPVPVGVVGELYLSGDAVARGYWRQPALEAQRFTKDPFCPERGRMYRTGDQGRWREDGTLEYLGRQDDQVKIRGFRVELGEIEAKLGRHPGVNEVAVLAKEGPGGQKRLIAYVTPRGGSVLSAELLRHHATSVLPDFMVPAGFVILDRMPVSPNGKRDRRLLPEPEATAFASPTTRPPEGALERKVADIWGELLQVPTLSRDDNFFELGGHSLLGMRLIEKVRRALGVQLSAISVFQHPTIEKMACVIEGLRAVVGDPVKAPVSNPDSALAVPLSFSQLAHWNLYRLDRGAVAIRQIASATRLLGHLNVEALRRSVAENVLRQEALRTRIGYDQGILVQHIDAEPDYRFQVEELSISEESRQQALVQQRIGELISQRIDPTKEPLFELRLLRLGPQEWVLIIVMEHLISDAFSMRVLLRDLFSGYVQSSEGRPFSLPKLERSFSAFAVQQQVRHPAWMHEHHSYWAELSSHDRRLSFPKEDGTSSGPVAGGWDTIHFRISDELKVSLAALCRAQKTTLVMGVFTAYVALVLRWCNVSDGIFQYQSDGRDPETENTVGFFASMLYVRAQLHGTDTFADLLDRLTAAYCGAFEHADHSYFAAQPEKPQFTHNSVFNWVPATTRVNLEETARSPGGLLLAPIAFQHPMAAGLTLDAEPSVLLFDTDDGIVGELWFPKVRCSAKRMCQFVEAFQNLLFNVTREPQVRIALLHSTAHGDAA
jgi:amino acid adenylation domain-containing protein